MKAEKLELIVFNAGHGDCCLLRFPTGCWGLVDSNYWPPHKRSPALSYFEQHEIKEPLSFLCISHYDADHFRGMSDVIKTHGKSIKCILAQDPRILAGSMFLKYQDGKVPARYQNDLKSIFGILGSPESEKKIESLVEIFCDDFGVELQVLYPTEAVSEQFTGKICRKMEKKIAGEAFAKPNFNEASISMVMTFGRAQILFGGDVLKAGWERILKNYPGLKPKLFKIPHHGSSFSISKEIWDKIAKNSGICAIISGEGSVSDPDREVLETIGGKGDLFCTNISIHCKGPLPQKTRSAIFRAFTQKMKSAKRTGSDERMAILEKQYRKDISIIDKWCLSRPYMKFEISEDGTVLLIDPKPDDLICYARKHRNFLH